MNVNVGDILEMKKPHPCGGNRMLVLRVGADFRLKCEKCGHDLMLRRRMTLLPTRTSIRL